MPPLFPEEDLGSDVDEDQNVEMKSKESIQSDDEAMENEETQRSFRPTASSSSSSKVSLKKKKKKVL